MSRTTVTLLGSHLTLAIFMSVIVFSQDSYASPLNVVAHAVASPFSFLGISFVTAGVLLMAFEALSLTKKSLGASLLFLLTLSIYLYLAPSLYSLTITSVNPVTASGILLFAGMGVAYIEVSLLLRQVIRTSHDNVGESSLAPVMKFEAVVRAVKGKTTHLFVTTLAVAVATLCLTISVTLVNSYVSSWKRLNLPVKSLVSPELQLAAAIFLSCVGLLFIVTKVLSHAYKSLHLSLPSAKQLVRAYFRTECTTALVNGRASRTSIESFRLTPIQPLRGTLRFPKAKLSMRPLLLDVALTAVTLIILTLGLQLVFGQSRATPFAVSARAYSSALQTLAEGFSQEVHNTIIQVVDTITMAIQVIDNWLRGF